MIEEGLPWVFDIGFVTITLSGKWMAKVGIAETKLLLCKATEVVMEKCFQLLRITPESSSLGDKQESLGLPRSLLQVGRLNHEDPPKNPNPRFQLFSIYVYIFGDPTLREYMFGKITISDTYGVLYDGWGLQDAPDRGNVTLFDCDWGDQIRVDNHGKLELGNPRQALVSLLRIDVQMKIRLLFGRSGKLISMPIFPFKGIRMVMYGLVYVLLRLASIVAIEDRFNSKIAGKVGEVPLKRSMMVVPTNGSIVIRARLHDYDSKEHGYLDGSCTFDAQPQGVFEEEI
ncbi:hypothetical protein Tco_0497681 [Tanacetum coccineum]